MCGEMYFRCCASDNTIEIRNTNIEFNEKSFHEFQHTRVDFKLFIDNPWTNAKKNILYQ